MAIYHLSVKTVSRSTGRSATGAAAYRAGVEIVDERTGLVHDYTRRSGVVSADLTLPANAPAWASDRAALWNGAELSETRKNSTVAREFELALPDELTAAQRRELVATFARELSYRHGIAVDAAIHLPDREGDKRNHHAHVLTTTRRLGPEGFGEKARTRASLSAVDAARPVGVFPRSSPVLRGDPAPCLARMAGRAVALQIQRAAVAHPDRGTGCGATLSDQVLLCLDPRCPRLPWLRRQTGADPLGTDPTPPGH